MNDYRPNAIERLMAQQFKAPETYEQLLERGLRIVEPKFCEIFKEELEFVRNDTGYSWQIKVSKELLKYALHIVKEINSKPKDTKDFAPQAKFLEDLHLDENVGIIEDILKSVAEFSERGREFGAFFAKYKQEELNNSQRAINKDMAAPKASKTNNNAARPL